MFSRVASGGPSSYYNERSLLSIMCCWCAAGHALALGNFLRGKYSVPYPTSFIFFQKYFLHVTCIEECAPSTETDYWLFGCDNGVSDSIRAEMPF